MNGSGLQITVTNHSKPNQSINQPVNQSVDNNPSNQSNDINQHQSVDQSIDRNPSNRSNDSNRHPNQPTNHYNVTGPHSPSSAHLARTIFASKSANQSISQSINQPIHHEKAKVHSISIDSKNAQKSTEQADRSIRPNRSIKPMQSINQSVNHSEDSFSSIIRQLLIEDLPSIFKPNPIRRKFARQLSLALKIVVAFILCSIIAVLLIDHSSSALALPYLSVLFVMLVAKQSVGDMMSVIDSQSKGVLMAVVIDCCLIAVGIPSIEDRIIRIITVELVMFFTSLLLAYRFSSAPARRYSLAIHGMSCIAMANNPNVPVYYPVQLFGSLIIAYIISIIVAGLPFPRLAKDELLDRYRLTAGSLSRTFSLLSKASLCVEPVLPDILRARTQLELESCTEQLAHMRRLEKETLLEADMWQCLFPWSLSLGSSVNPDIDQLELLCWDLRSFHHSLKRVNYQSEYHASYARYMRPGLSKLDLAQKAFFNLICNEDSVVLTRASVALRKQQLSGATEVATRNFLAARDHTYGYDNVDKDHYSFGDVDSLSKHQQYQPNNSLGMRRVSSNRFLDTVQEGQRGTRRRSDSETDECRLSSTLTHSTNEYFLRSTVFFCITRFQSIIQNMELCGNRHISDTITSFSPKCPPAESQISDRQANRKRAIRDMFRSSWKHPWQCSLLGLHPIRDFCDMISDLLNFLVRPSINLIWLRSSFKVALIICVSSLVSVVPQIVDSGMLPNSVWSLWTAAVLTSDTEGGLYQRSMFRLFGTFVGGAVGYLVVLAFPCTFSGPDDIRIGLSYQIDHCTSWTGSVALLALWIFLMSLVQESKYSYLGTMSGFSSIVIVFGVVVNNPARLSAAEYSVARQVEIYIGVIVSLLISCTIYPTNSIRLLRAEFADSCQQILEAVNDTVAFYQSVVQSDQYSNLFNKLVDSSTSCSSVVDEAALLVSISAHSKVISRSLAYQYQLIGSAMYEPTSLFRPFSVAKHKHVCHLIRIVWMTMALVESAVRSICKADRQLLASTDEAAHVELLSLTDYNGVLRSLIEQVSALLNNCIMFLQNSDNADSTEQSFIHLSLSERVDVTATQVIRSSHFIQSRFAHSLNAVAINVRSAQCKPPPVELMVPIAVFLSSCIQCSQLAVRLVQAVGTLQHKSKAPEYEE